MPEKAVLLFYSFELQILGRAASYISKKLSEL